MSTVTFKHPVRTVYIAKTLEEAKKSAFFKRIEDKINKITESTRTPLIDLDDVIIIKDLAKANDEVIAEVVEGWFAKELKEGNKDYEELVQLVKINLSFVR